MNIRKIYIVIVCLGLSFLQACKKDVKSTNKEILNIEIEDFSETNKSSQKKINVKLLSVNDSDVFGSAIFKEEEGKVTLIALVNNLEKGHYKMYIVNNESCSNLIENESQHWNPTNQKHGSWGDKLGYHRGDVGALKIDDLLKNGTLSFSTNEWCIGCNDDTKNIFGKGLIVVHEDDNSKADNKNNIILSCGLIEKTN